MPAQLFPGGSMQEGLHLVSDKAYKSACAFRLQMFSWTATVPAADGRLSNMPTGTVTAAQLHPA
jgi:hypothetical protein